MESGGSVGEKEQRWMCNSDPFAQDHIHTYIYIYIHISTTVPLGAPGRVRSIVWVSDCLVFFVFKGAHPPGDGFTCSTCRPKFDNFLHFF